MLSGYAKAVKAVSKVGKFSDIACSIISCLIVGIFMPKNTIVTKFCYLAPGGPVIMPHRVYQWGLQSSIYVEEINNKKHILRVCWFIMCTSTVNDVIVRFVVSTSLLVSVLNMRCQDVFCNLCYSADLCSFCSTCVLIELFVFIHRCRPCSTSSRMLLCVCNHDRSSCSWLGCVCCVIFMVRSHNCSIISILCDNRSQSLSHVVYDNI